MTVLPNPGSKYYIAGPMTGYPNFNIDTFKKAKVNLEQLGYPIALPYDIENAVNPDWEWGDYLGEDIKIVCKCRGIILLPEWERSRGARVEIAAALMQALKYDFQFFEYWENGDNFGVDELTKTEMRSIYPFT